MAKTFAQKQIVRICCRGALISLLALGILCLALRFLAPDLINLYFRQDMPVDAESLAARLKARQVCVSTMVEDFYFTGYSITFNDIPTNKYYTYYDGQRYVLCDMPPDVLPDKIARYWLVGVIQPFQTADLQVVEGIAGIIAKDYDMTPEAAMDQFAIVKISGMASIPKRQGLTALVLVPVAVCMVLLARNLWFMGRYTQHKAYTALALDADLPAEQVDALITQDLECLPLLRTKDITITDSWALLTAPNMLTVRRREDLVWAYGNIDRQTRNKGFSLSLMFKDGLEHTIPLRDRRAGDALLHAIRDVVPWMLVGYSYRTLTLYREDMPAFLKLCEETYAQTQKEQEEI